MTQVILTTDQKSLIRKAAEKNYPRECCGLLIGRGEKIIEVSDVVLTRNMAEEDHLFLIDPQVQLAWLQKLRGTDQRIVGNYHSHPNGRAEPSEIDISFSLEAGQVWLIVVLQDGRMQEIKAYISSSNPRELRGIPLNIE